MALSNLKNSFTGKAAAIGLGTVVALTPLTGAFAEDGNVQQTASAAYSQRAIDQIELKGGDIRGKGADFADIVAVKGSRSHLVVKIHTNDPEVIAEVNLTLRSLALGGRYTRLALLVADGPNGYDNTGEIYALSTDGKPNGSLRNLDGSRVASVIIDGVENAYPSQWKATAALPSGPVLASN